MVGIIAGIGAIIFKILLDLSTNFFLVFLAGYEPPAPAGEESLIKFFTATEFRRALLFFIPAIGGLFSGIIVYTFAPEAEGHGTDAVIEAYHRQKGEIRSRVPIIKTIASAITIGSGGSAGREGPIAQIGAGFGSYIAKKTRTSAREREILTIAGAAAGIGSIFKAPFGGSLFGIEVLYKEDYEVDAFIPAIISTFVGYSIYALFIGWQPIFSAPQYIFVPFQLPFFVILGILCGLLARVYVWFFYFIHESFKRLEIPNHFKPMIGGLLTGAIAVFFPQVIGVGYGYLQEAMNGNLLLEIMLILIFAKIAATSFSIGSGGSGGVFAPSIVIGGMAGGLFGTIIQYLFPNLRVQIGIFVIIGMAAFFAGAAKVPIASIIMVSEMTWDYGILIPAILASIMSYIIAGELTIYRSQVRNKAESSVHITDFFYITLSKFKVSEAMTVDVLCVEPENTLDEVEKFVAHYGYSLFPVVDDNGKILGVITLREIVKVPYKDRKNKTVQEVMIKDNIYITPNDSLARALMLMIERNITKLPVIDPKDKRVIGLITMRDISKVVYYKGLELIR